VDNKEKQNTLNDLRSAVCDIESALTKVEDVTQRVEELVVETEPFDPMPEAIVAWSKDSTEIMHRFGLKTYLEAEPYERLYIEAFCMGVFASQGHRG